jgi:hypothetical protein
MIFIPNTSNAIYSLICSTFFAFFQACIQLKHKQHNILLLGSFSTLSSIAKDKMKTIISFNKRKNEYNKTEAPPLLVMVRSKAPLSSHAQNHRKKGESELPHIVAATSTKNKKTRVVPFCWQLQGANLFHLATFKSTKKKKKKRKQGSNYVPMLLAMVGEQSFFAQLCPK